MSKRYTVEQFKQILPRLPQEFEAWVDYNPKGEGSRTKLKFRIVDGGISSHYFEQLDIKDVDYAWNSYWLNDTYKGTFELVKPLEKTSLRDMEVGDIIVDEYDNHCKVLAVVGETFGLSYSGEYDEFCCWYTFTEAEKLGWKLQNQVDNDIKEVTLEEVAKAMNVPVEKLRIKD